MPTDLERSLYHTFCWFSLWGYPLTAFEVWKWMWQPAQHYTLADVYAALESEWLSTRLEREESFFALSEQEEGVHVQILRRRERFVDATRKYKKLTRAARWFALFSSVQGVAAVNTLAWWHTSRQSDIDLYIIVRPRTLWSTRLLLVAPFLLLGKRPKQGVVDPFCFSFFVSEERMCTQPFSLPQEDPYLLFWTRSLVPVFDRAEVFDHFAKQNAWTHTSLPNSFSRAVARQHKRRRFVSFCLSFLEPLARALQSRRLPGSLRALANRDTRVVVADDVLKFHENDTRESLRERFAFLKQRV